LLASIDERHTFAGNIEKLVLDRELRKTMGREAGDHVRRVHDLEKNYGVVEQKLDELTRP
jgi:hypothetical protein